MAGKVFVNVSMDAEADKDIITWLNGQKNKSEAVRVAIRDHLGRAGVTLHDVYQEIRNLERQVKAGAVVVGDTTGGASTIEPPDIAEALDKLADIGGYENKAAFDGRACGGAGAGLFPGGVLLPSPGTGCGDGCQDPRGTGELYPARAGHVDAHKRQHNHADHR